MLHEAINWNFSEFSPSPILSLFCAIYSLIVSTAARLNKFNGFWSRARELSTKRVSKHPATAQKNWRFRIAKCGNGREESHPKGELEISTMCNCPIGYGRHLPCVSIFPNYIWPFPFPAKPLCALLTSLLPSRNPSPRAAISWNFFNSLLRFCLRLVHFDCIVRRNALE